MYSRGPCIPYAASAARAAPPAPDCDGFGSAPPGCKSPAGGSGWGKIGNHEFDADANPSRSCGLLGKGAVYFPPTCGTPSPRSPPEGSPAARPAICGAGGERARWRKCRVACECSAFWLGAGHIPRGRCMCRCSTVCNSEGGEPAADVTDRWTTVGLLQERSPSKLSIAPLWLK